MKNKTVLGLALLCVLLLVGLVLTFLRVSDLKTTIADLETSTDQQITDLETSTDQQIADLETVASELCREALAMVEIFHADRSSLVSQGGQYILTWDCEFSGQ